MTKDQLSLLMHINEINYQKDVKISNDLSMWNEIGVKSIKDFVEYMNFEFYRQIDFFERDYSDSQLEEQANEFEYYNNYR